MSVTRAILQRTFRIHYKGQAGTCFTIDVSGRRYLITARHVVESIRSNAVVEIERNRKWTPLLVRLVGHGAGDIDISALSPQALFGESYPLRLTTADLTLAEDVYFLGFPFGLSMEMKTELNAGFPLPLVKRAVVSALGLKDGPMLLDGHNNAGFSGGPVVRSRANVGQTVIGVVSGYKSLKQNVRDKYGKETSFTYQSNTGIIEVIDIRHALVLIARNPIGILVK